MTDLIKNIMQHSPIFDGMTGRASGRFPSRKAQMDAAFIRAIADGAMSAFEHEPMLTWDMDELDETTNTNITEGA